MNIRKGRNSVVYRSFPIELDTCAMYWGFSESPTLLERSLAQLYFVNQLKSFSKWRTIINTPRNNDLYKNSDVVLVYGQLIFTNKLENYIIHCSMTFINNAN